MKKISLISRLSVFGKLMILTVFLFTGCAAACQTQPACSKPKEEDKLTSVLNKMKEAGGKMNSYQSRIDYTFLQPLFDSKTVRKGFLYYKKTEKESKLRISFNSLKQDESDERDYKEDYLFDGIWLSHFDYEIKQVRMQQLVEPNDSNAPVDIFELASENFPIVGFSDSGQLRNNFDIDLLDSNKEDSDIQKLHLVTKPDSKYIDDYKELEVRLDKKTFLPIKITATTTEDEIYRISFIEAKINEEIPESYFQIKIPKGFNKEVITKQNPAVSRG